MIDLSRLDEYEQVEEGYTNQVYITDRDTVLKKYRDYSASALFHSLRELLVSQELLLAEDRIEAEKDIREALDNKVEYPGIVDVEGNWLELEFIEGPNLLKYIEENPGEARQKGVEFGELVETVHGNQVYLSDWALDDVIVTDQGLVMLDFEFGGVSEHGFRFEHDKISVFTRAARLDPEVYQDFMDSFESVTRISRGVKIMGFILSFGFNLFYAWHDGRPVNVLKNAVQEVR